MEEAFLRIAVEPSLGLGTGARVWIMDDENKSHWGVGGGGEGGTLLEHLASFYRGKPKAVSVCIVIASPAAVALDEWGASELFQTGPRGGQGLARTFRSGAGVLRGNRSREPEVPAHPDGLPGPQGRAGMLPPGKPPSLSPEATGEHTGSHTAPWPHAGHTQCQESADRSSRGCGGEVTGPASPAFQQTLSSLFSSWNTETSSNLGREMTAKMCGGCWDQLM